MTMMFCFDFQTNIEISRDNVPMRVLNHSGYFNAVW